MIFLQRARDDRVETGDVRPEAQRGTDQCRLRLRRAACSQSWCRRCRSRPGADAAHAAAGSILHDAGVDAEDGGAGLGAQHVGVGDVQVVARDGDIEIVFERQRNGVIQRKIELAVVHELVDARSVGQIRRRQMPRRVGPDRIRKMRHRLGSNSGPATGCASGVFCGVGAAGGSWPQHGVTAFRGSTFANKMAARSAAI